MTDEDEDRVRPRRGCEHVRIQGTTEELGEIIPAPVRVEPPRDEVPPPDDAELVELDDGEEIGRR